MSMDRETLRLLVDLAETGSFSKTASKHFISQSAVSQRVHALEAQFGARLVERGRGRPGTALTPAGETVLTAAREILTRLSALERELAELSGSVSGELHVSTVYSLGLHGLTSALSRFLAAYPDVNLRLEYLRTDRIYDAVAAGTTDCGIVACPRERAQIEVVRLADEVMVVALPPEHPLAAEAAIPIADLSGHRFVAFDPDIPTRQLIDSHLERQGVTVSIVHCFDNIETIKRVVEIGQGIAIVPETTVRRERSDGSLAVRPLADAALVRPTGMLLRKGRPRSAALSRFLETLRADP
jgi:molybdate transport repressor ModE-like protein